ncbi:MAG: Xaa-Pro peptidase family protein [Planctomycetota bacterium]|nr:Xaa-Pro peptidase family protein [Planctomycetota bacterium]
MTIPLKEYATRRTKVLAALKGAAGIVFAGDESHALQESWKPHAHFQYLTGLMNESGSAILFDPTNPVKSKQVILFLRPLNPEMEKWDGLRQELGSGLAKTVGIKTIMRTTYMPRVIADVITRAKTFATLMPLSPAGVSPDLSYWQQVTLNVPECSIRDASHVIPSHRSVKSKAEIDIIQEAVNITANGFKQAMAVVAGGLNEYKVQATLEYGYAMAGGRGSAFPPIVGGGLNSTVLHYKDNDQDLVDGDLVCIDSGAAFNGYGADITRTIPVNGKFTKRQKEIYNIVLKAEEAAIKAVKPGITMAEVDSIARAIIVKAGYGDNFIHSIGHHLGLETHDTCGPDKPLKTGAVVTIEPGIYIPEEAIGVRIEDDILVTAKGRKNLSSKIPKSVSDIEKVMRG